MNLVKKTAFVFVMLCVLITAFIPIQAEVTPEKIDKDAIIKDPEWQKNFDIYQFDDSIVQAITSKISKSLHIDVYYGLWCSDSKINIPPFLKIMDAINQTLDAGLTVNYFSLSRKPNKEDKYFIETLKIEKVPTFIVYRDNKEIGRIVENPQKTLEEDLMEIVFQ